jgi:hypothetical protein
MYAEWPARCGHTVELNKILSLEIESGYLYLSSDPGGLRATVQPERNCQSDVSATACRARFRAGHARTDPRTFVNNQSKFKVLYPFSTFNFISR